jgi:quinoprotein glucose dehydrogenase
MKYLIVLSVIVFLFTHSIRAPRLPDTDWAEYNGDGARSHYSPLNQITRENASQLTVAWEYASGGADTTGNRSQMQCNPIIVGGILYGH